MIRSRPREPLGRPSVSVVIPCYNYGHFLAGATASALNHRGLEIDVTIIDDASTDDSADVARSIAAGDPRVRTLVHAENRGHIATYNEGLLAATGDYVILLSADDLLAPDALTRAVGLMEAHPSVGLCYGYSPEFETDPPTARTRMRRHSVWDGQEWMTEIARRGRNVLSTPEAVMRTSLFVDIGGYDTEHPHAGDFVMWLRAASRADVGRVNGADQAFYRVHGSNMHLTTFAGLRIDFEERRKAFTTFLELDGELVRDRAAFEAAWTGAMAREGVKLALDALDSRPPDLQLADEFLALARDVRPGVTGSRDYAVVGALRDQRPARLARPRWKVRRVLRSLEWKVRWRRWRWGGL